MYKKSPFFETSIGGVCTVITGTLLIYWLAVNILYTILPPGIFSTNVKTELLQNKDGSYPVTSVPSKRIFTMYKLNSSDEALKDLD